MALSKLIETSYGIQAEYHKITETKIDWHNKVANLTVKSFVSLETRTSGKMPITEHSYYWSGDDFIFTPTTNVLEVAYTKLKLLSQWENSIDA